MTFAAFDATGFTALTIDGWTGILNSSGTGGHILLANTSGLTPAVLNNITFTGFGTGLIGNE